MQFTYTVLTATLQAPSFFRSYQNSNHAGKCTTCSIRKVVVSVTQSIYANPNWLHRIISSVIVINICSRVRKRMTLPGRKHYPLNLLKDKCPYGIYLTNDIFNTTQLLENLTWFPNLSNKIPCILSTVSYDSIVALLARHRS